MALLEREAFKELTIKATEEGLFGELMIGIEIYDDVTSEVRSSRKHRQVAQLDDLSKTYTTPLGQRSIADLVNGLNVDIAATNAILNDELVVERGNVNRLSVELAAEKAKGRNRS